MMFGWLGVLKFGCVAFLLQLVCWAVMVMHAKAHLCYYATDGIKQFLVFVCELGEIGND